MTSYYIAIQPPIDDTTRIAAVMRQLGDPSPLPHITVKAPNGLTPSLEWLPKVRDAAARFARFNITIAEPGTFGNRVLYLAVHSIELVELHQRILEVVAPTAELVARFGEDRPYTPHLTLAVAHNAGALPAYEQEVSCLRDLEPFEAHDLTVFRRDDSSSLYRSWMRLPLET